MDGKIKKLYKIVLTGGKCLTRRFGLVTKKIVIVPAGEDVLRISNDFHVVLTCVTFQRQKLHQKQSTKNNYFRLLSDFNPNGFSVIFLVEC